MPTKTIGFCVRNERLLLTNEAKVAYVLKANDPRSVFRVVVRFQIRPKWAIEY